jgi:hypothetical protein
MVFARARLLIEDRCFEEKPSEIHIRYSGPHVAKLYKKCWELMQAVFDVPQSYIQETQYKWVKKGEGDAFQVRWWLHKDMDVFSYIYFRLDLKGKGTDKSGEAFIRLKAWLRSEYPQDTVWQRSIFYEILRTFWHRLFYRQRREEYREECRNSMVMYEKQLKDFFQKIKEM